METRNIKRGITAGFILVAAGFALQAVAGPIDWSRLAYPVNLIAAAGFVAGILVVYLCFGKRPAIMWLGSAQAAVVAACFTAAATVVMGLVAQKSSTYDLSYEHTLSDLLGLSRMTSNWAFVALYAWTLVTLGFAILRHGFPLWWNRALFLLLHVGLFWVLLTASAGAADRVKARVAIETGQSVDEAMTRSGTLVKLPFAMTLDRLSVDSDAADKAIVSPTASLRIATRKGMVFEGQSRINAPLKAGEWRVYVIDTRPAADPNAHGVILELVCDPWQGAIEAGLWIMLAGAVGMITRMVGRKGGGR